MVAVCHHDFLLEGYEVHCRGGGWVFFILFLSTTRSSAWQSITDMVHLLWIACKYTRRGQRALLLCDIPNDKDLVVIVQWNLLSDSGGHENGWGRDHHAVH